jgi:hypothetical protein
VAFYGHHGRRYNSSNREQLDAGQLAELRKTFAAMPQHELARFYRATYTACRYEVRLPSPRMIQELVQAWEAVEETTV